MKYVPPSVAITKEDVEERIKGLAEERENLIAQVNAFNGAIEDCKYWLDVLGEQNTPDTAADDE